MSNTSKNKTNKNQCETNTDSCSTTEYTVTTKSVNYARTCIILLALNFCITGYVLVSSLKLQEQASSIPTTTPSAGTTSLSADDRERQGDKVGATKPTNYENVVEELRAIRTLQEQYRDERREVKE